MMMNLDNIKMQQVDNNNSSVNENSNNFNLNHNSAMKTSSATIEHRDEKMCEHTVQKTDKQQVSKYDTDPLLRDIMNKINSTEKVLITPKRNFGRRYLKKLESSTNNDDFKSNNNNNNDSNTNEHQTKSAALSDDRNFEYFNLESSSSSLKQSTIPEQQNENNSYIDYSNSMLNRFAYFDIHNNSSISTTNSYSKNYFEYQRNETLRRQELLKQNANLVNLFAKTKYTEIEEEEIECDNNINNNNKNIDEIVDKNDENIDDQIKIDNKVIKTFSADESVAEIEIDNFQPQFAKDIDFEILKHPVSRQFRYTSNENNRIETMTDSKNRNNPKKTNNTKSSGKKKESSSKKISLKVPETSKNRLKFIPLSLEDKFDSVKTIDKSETKSKSLPESLDQIMYLNKSATNCLNNDENKNNNIANKSREMSSLTSKSKSSPDFAKIQKTAEKYAKYLTPTKKKNDEKSGSGSVKKNPEFKIHNITVNKRIYQVLNQIGRGGSSIVYQVYSPDTKKTLALKKVNLNNADKAVVDGFRSEINLLKRLRRCQRVVRMYDYEFLNGNKELLIVMEKGDADLSQVLKSHHQLSSKLSPHVIRLYWQEMLEAVKEIHDAQIVHADLKLVNFILVSGTLKLIDFGIANTIQSNQTNVYKDVIVGTVDYMAPESFLKRSEHQNKVKYNQKVDIWSLGIILYTLVYGHTPFSHLGSDMIKKGMAIVNADIQYEPIDDDLVLDVIKKCLQKDPKKRPNPDELLQHRYLTLKNGKNSTNSPTNGNSEAKRVNDNNNIPPELLSQMSKLSPNTLKSFSKFVTKLAQK